MQKQRVGSMRTHGRALRVLTGVLCIHILCACSDSNDAALDGQTQIIPLTSCADTQSCLSNPPLEIVESRPSRVKIPSNYTSTTRYPLIIVLHGFRVSGYLQAIYLGLTTRVDALQYVLVFPDGTENREGERFWNANPLCCAPSGEEFDIDDVAYIRTLIEEAAATYSIDVNRIGLIGHSNGGAMALRMVCDASDLVTAAVSFAGFTVIDDESCAPVTHPVSVLTMHGDEDYSVLYDGGEFNAGPYPGALETVRRFAAHAKCDTTTPVMAANLDVNATIDGAETTVLQYRDCAPGVNVDLWTLVGSPHAPLLTGSALDSIVGWIIDHPRI